MPALPSRTALLVGLCAAGPLVSLVILGIGAPLQSYPERRMLDAWLTTTTAPWRALGVDVDTHRGVTVSVAVLVALWLTVAVLLARRPTGGRLIPAAAVAWITPFALGAPFLSRDIYAYLGQGELMRRGFAPYRDSVSVLPAQSPVLEAVDPLWRETIPPYGPLWLRVEHLAAWLGHGHEWLGLVVLRVVAVVSVLTIIWLVRREAPPERKDLVTWLAVSPLVLMQLVGAAHLDAMMAALAVSAVVLLRRGHLVWAAVAAVAAAEVKATAGLVFIALLVHVWQSQGRDRALRFLGAAGAAGLIALLLLPSDPLGWVRNLGTPGLTWVPFTPSSTLLLIIRNLGADPPWLVEACRAFMTVVGLGVAVWALRSSREWGAAWTAALLLLAFCIGGPVLWPWYLAASALLLLLAGPGWTPLAVALGLIGSMMALPVGIVGAQRLAFATEVLALAGVLWAAHHRHRARASGPASAGRSASEGSTASRTGG